MNVKPAKQPGHVPMDVSPSDSERLSKSVENDGASKLAFKLKKILLPVDFSDCSKKALQYAIPFAKQFGAEIVLLHVLPIRFVEGWKVDAVECEPLIEGDLKNYAQEQLAQLAGGMAASEIPVEVQVRHGAPAIEIVTAAKELAVDIIVMSTHGHTGRVHAFIGSVAGDVTRLAPCPVLVVREREHEFVPSGPSSLKDNQALPGLVPANAA